MESADCLRAPQVDSPQVQHTPTSRVYDVHLCACVYVRVMLDSSLPTLEEDIAGTPCLFRSQGLPFCLHVCSFLSRAQARSLVSAAIVWPRPSSAVCSPHSSQTSLCKHTHAHTHTHTHTRVRTLAMMQARERTCIHAHGSASHTYAHTHGIPRTYACAHRCTQVLRMPPYGLSPHKAADVFSTDPIRVLRAVRFAAGFGLAVDPGVTRREITKHAHRCKFDAPGRCEHRWRGASPSGTPVLHLSCAHAHSTAGAQYILRPALS